MRIDRNFGMATHCCKLGARRNASLGSVTYSIIHVNANEAFVVRVLQEVS